MKVRIVKNMSKAGEGNISHLIGKEFEVVEREEKGVHIKYGMTSGYWLHNGEFEVVEEDAK